MDRLLDQNSFAASMTSSALLLPQKRPSCPLLFTIAVWRARRPATPVRHLAINRACNPCHGNSFSCSYDYFKDQLWRSGRLGSFRLRLAAVLWGPIFLDYCTQALNKSRHKSAQMPTCKQKRFELGDMRHKMLLTLALQLVRVRRS